MNISKEELEFLKPIHNTVIFKPDKVLNDSFKTQGGIQLFFPADQSCEIMYHVGVYGTIVKQPERLVYSKPLANEKTDMPWLIDLETKEGDSVIVNYRSIYEALERLADPVRNPGNPKWFTCEKELYVFLHYKDLIAINGKEIIPINGHVLCEQLDEEEKIKTTLILPEHLRKIGDQQKFAKVLKTGSLIRDYEGDNYSPDTDDVKEGDIIIFEKFYNIELEFKIHQKLDKHYMRIQRKNIVAIVPKEMYESERVK